MTIRRSRWRQGIPCWIELMADDVPTAWRFYSAVLGWTVPTRDEESPGFVLAESHGAVVAGLGRSREGSPIGWTVYLSTDDVVAGAAAAADLGGAVLGQPIDVRQGEEQELLGRSAIVADPVGARFGLWEAGSLNGSQLVNEPGGLCFEELRSADPTTSGAFYADLFGYTLAEEPRYGADYRTFRLPDEQLALGGVRALVDGDPLPAGWTPFFGVRDADTACREALDQGGSVLLATFETPDDQVALLADPEGTPFWVITSTGEEQPDRSG